jgi:hypothetical protein
MDAIIRNELNEAFLKEGEERGFRPYIDSFKARDNENTPGFYQGSIQKRVSDSSGTRYFINIDMFDMSSVSSRATYQWSARAWVQFHLDDEDDDTADVAMSFESFAKTEAFFADMWKNMKFGYYDAD